MRKVIVIFIIIQILLSGCQTKSKMIDSLDSIEFSKTKLRNSGYFVKHPTTMQLSVDEWYHSWQDSSFVICKPDSLPPYSNTFGIRLGCPDSAKFMGWDLPIIARVQSQVLGSIIDWSIRKSDTGYFVADARRRDMKFVATSVTQPGIDSMIALVSTLSLR